MLLWESLIIFFNYIPTKYGKLEMFCKVISTGIYFICFIYRTHAFLVDVCVCGSKTGSSVTSHVWVM